MEGAWRDQGTRGPRGEGQDGRTGGFSVSLSPWEAQQKVWRDTHQTSQCCPCSKGDDKGAISVLWGFVLLSCFTMCGYLYCNFRHK